MMITTGTGTGTHMDMDMDMAVIPTERWVGASSLERVASVLWPRRVGASASSLTAVWRGSASIV